MKAPLLLVLVALVPAVAAAQPTPGALLDELTAMHGFEEVAVSPDGTRVLTASWDYTARLWDLAGLTRDPGKAERYRDAALTILDTLCTDRYVAWDTPGPDVFDCDATLASCSCVHGCAESSGTSIRTHRGSRPRPLW